MEKPAAEDAPRRPSWAVGLALLAALALVAGRWVWDATVTEPRARVARAELNAEYDRIVQPAGARMVERLSAKRAGQATAGASWASAADADSLKYWFVDELSRLGWEFAADVPVKEGSQDSTGRLVTWRKGRSVASLQFSGDTLKTRWRYALWLSW